MDKKTYLEDIEKLKLPEFESYPDIELYMDQVISCLMKSRISADDSEVLTAPMVNNYIKEELLPRANGKKYSREHIANLALIVRLKQILSVKDVKTLMEGFKEDKSGKEFYDIFSGNIEKSCSFFVQQAEKEEKIDMNFAMRMAVISFVAKMVAQFVIEEQEALQLQEQEKKKKKTDDQKKKPKKNENKNK